MGQFTHNGVIYEEMPNGKARVIGYQDQEAPKPVTLGKPRPPEPRQAPSGYRWTANGNLEPIPGGPGDPSRTNPPNAPRPTPGVRPMTPQQQQQLTNRLATLGALRNQIATVADMYRKGPGATKGLGGLYDYLPTPSNKAFDSAGAGLGELGLAAFRVPGVGAQSDAELRAFVDANRPSSSDYDASIEQKLSNLQNRLAASYQAMGKKYQPVQIGAAQPKTKQQSRVVDFNDLPE